MTRPLLRPPVSSREHLRRRMGAVVVDGFFSGTARLGRAIPLSRPSLHGVEVVRDVAYQDTGLIEHRLDVYRPAAMGAARPVVLYLHGGGFRILSKETHWLFGLIFARRGYVVFNANYRLAPAHPFPAALEDASAAYTWVLENAARFGGDPTRVIVAGESAGGNLALAMALMATYRRPEPYAQKVFATGVVPKAILPACGLLQVSDPERFQRSGAVPWYILDRLTEVTDAYLHGLYDEGQGVPPLVDPLIVLERAAAPERPFPACFATCGTGDALWDDTQRLTVALHRLGADVEMSLFPGEVHAFHAFVMRASARRHWRETFAFLDRVLAARP